MSKQAFVEAITDTLAKEIVAMTKNPHQQFAIYLSNYETEAAYTLLSTVETGGGVPTDMMKVDVRGCDFYLPLSNTQFPVVRQLVHSVWSIGFIRSTYALTAAKLRDPGVAPPQELFSHMGLHDISNPQRACRFDDHLEIYESELRNEFAALEVEEEYFATWCRYDTEESQLREAFGNFVEAVMGTVVRGQDHEVERLRCF
jgi:hypothetical protein